jgi:hypothetical protein
LLPNFTELVLRVAPKPLPLMVMRARRLPEAGLSLVILGSAGAVTVKLAALVATPPGVVTLIVPVVAAGGTVAVICVLLGRGEPPCV